MPALITFVMPYYENAQMLPIHLRSWQHFDESFSFIIVDDGSPTLPAVENLPEDLAAKLGDRLQIYRVTVDIPWNQHGARNLGAQQARSRWLFMTDMDSFVSPESGAKMAALPLDEASGRNAFYKFPGRTMSNKPRDPWFNTFLCTREAFIETGGYDEDYCGTYGGDSYLLRGLAATRELRVPPHVTVQLYDRDRFPQASTTQLDKDYYRELFLKKEAEKKAAKNTMPRNPIRFPWVRVR